VPGLPAGNLQMQERSYVMRSTSAAPQSVYGNLAAGRLVADDGAALFGEFSSSATVRIRLYSGVDRTGSLLYDSATLPVAPRGKAWFVRFGGAGVYASFQLDLTDAAPPLGWHDLSRLVLGRMFTPEINVGFDYGYSIEDDTEQERDASGGIHSSPGAVYNSLSFTFGHLTDAERAELHSALLACGKTRDVFCALRPGHAYQYDFCMLAKFTTLPAIKNPYPNRYAAPFGLSETAGGYAGALEISPSAGGGSGVGGMSSEWTQKVEGLAALTSSQPVASNGNGIVVVAYQGRTLMRSADHGLTWLPVVVSACPSRILDITWSGAAFLACGDSGDGYHSADGASWTALASTGDGAMNMRFDALFAWPDGIFVAAGQALWAGQVGGFFADFSLESGWSTLTNPACAAVVRATTDAVLVFPAYQGGLVARRLNSTSMWSYWIAAGSSGNWTRAFAYGDNQVLAVTSANALYRSNDGGLNFFLVYTPPANYLIHDAILVLGTVLALSLAGPGADRRIVISGTAEAGSFSEIPVSAPVRSSQFSRLAWSGQRAIITDAGAVWVSGALV
jgi:hypothetical protein